MHVVGESLVRRADLGASGIFHNVNLTLVSGAMRSVVEIQVVGESVNCASKFWTEGRRHDQGFSVRVVLENNELGVIVQRLLIIQVII